MNFVFSVPQTEFRLRRIFVFMADFRLHIFVFGHDLSFSSLRTISSSKASEFRLQGGRNRDPLSRVNAHLQEVYSHSHSDTLSRRSGIRTFRQQIRLLERNGSEADGKAIRRGAVSEASTESSRYMARTLGCQAGFTTVSLQWLASCLQVKILETEAP